MIIKIRWNNPDETFLGKKITTTTIHNVTAVGVVGDELQVKTVITTESGRKMGINHHYYSTAIQAVEVIEL